MIREAVWTVRHAEHQLRHGVKAWPGQLRAWGRFWRSVREYQRLAPSEGQIKWKHLIPCLGDDCAETAVDPIYFYQDAWAFERVVQQRPKRHFDVGSHHKY